ncbi:peptidoglycan DD-metalloendopeptidase family protein [Hamadaea tsunoensis]|uniref:peptidoglycan DD-metalloendopeptidase family protein n=1 Tax=Hamadaea tsunoensis TaxID=53368 RepID=UPI00042350BC|nr:peptidoglycan DD-metalloendopeptidase family protein [Hamadaea tsunoensis]
MDRRSILFTAAAVAGATALGVTARPRAANAGAATPIDLDVQPLEAGDVRYDLTTPPQAGGNEEIRVVLRLRMKNTGAAPVRVTGIEYSFPGVGLPALSMPNFPSIMGNNGVVAAGETRFFSNGHVKVNGNVVDTQLRLGTPAPPQIRVRVFVDGYAQPETQTYDLAPYGTGHRMPIFGADLAPGELLYAPADHWANGSSQGEQLWAHDIDVKRWDGGHWTNLRPGTKGDANADYLIWGKPVRAVADSTLVDKIPGDGGMPDNPAPGALPAKTPSPTQGNYVILSTDADDTYVLYTHMRQHSIRIGVDDNYNTVPVHVRKGDIIGYIGSSGNAAAPHIHLEAHSFAAVDDNFVPRPWLFDEAWVLEIGAASPWNPESGKWVPAGTRGLPHAEMLIWPDTRQPGWWPPHWAEIYLQSVPAAGYQTEFDKVTQSGYRPVFVDAYEDDEDVFFNTVFRWSTGGQWDARHGMSLTEFTAAVADHRETGWLLTNVTTYIDGTVSGGVAYAAIWDRRTKASPAQEVRIDVGAAVHDATDKDLRSKGYHPVNVSIVAPGGVPQFTSFYNLENVGTVDARPWLSEAEFQAAYTADAQAGLNLTYFTACQVKDGYAISAIWSQSAPGHGPTSAKDGLDADAFLGEVDGHVADGWLTRAVGAYAVDGKPRFGGAWRKP